MLKFLLLQHRRFGFGTFFVFMSGLVIFSNNPWPLWAMVLIAALFALIILTLALIGVALFPRFRTIFELLGVLLFVFAVFEAMAPNLFAVLGDTGQLLAYVFTFAVLEYYLYGAGQHKLPAPAKWTGVSQFDSLDSPEDLWARLVPDPDDPRRYYTKRLKEMTRGDSDTRFRVLWAMGGSNFVAQDIEVTENLPLQRFSYRYGGLVSEQNAPMNSGTWTVEFQPGADGTTHVTITETIERTRLGAALFLWFDNWAEQVTEQAAAKFSGRKDRSIFRIIDQYIDETA